MQGETVLRKADVLAVPTRDAVMFMDVQSGQYMILQETARDIWQLIDGKRSVAEIIEHLTRSYEVERAQCEADVNEFLQQLRANTMVEIVE